MVAAKSSFAFAFSLRANKPVTMLVSAFRRNDPLVIMQMYWGICVLYLVKWSCLCNGRYDESLQPACTFRQSLFSYELLSFSLADRIERTLRFDVTCTWKALGKHFHGS